MGLAPARPEPGDKVAVILGSSSPIILRPKLNGNFSVMGEAMVYGLHDSRALLGPVPAPWKVEISLLPFRVGYEFPIRLGYVFLNEDTGFRTDNDPRLPKMGEDSEWTFETNCSAVFPESLWVWRNKTTGEVIDSDPRMEPDALREMGVNLVDIRLE